MWWWLFLFGKCKGISARLLEDVPLEPSMRITVESCRRDTGNLEMFLDSTVMISSRMGVLHFWSSNTEIPDAIRASQQCLVVAGVSKCSVTVKSLSTPYLIVHLRFQSHPLRRCGKDCPYFGNLVKWMLGLWVTLDI